MRVVTAVLAGVAFCGTFAGCSTNGIEGQVLLAGADRPMPDIQVVARAETNIKQEMTRAEKRATTDKNGRYQLSGLLAQDYDISVLSSRYRATPLTVRVPKKGTVLADRPLIAYPVVEAGAILVANPPDYELRPIAQLGTPVTDFRRINATHHSGGLGFGVTLHMLTASTVSSHRILLPAGSVVYYRSSSKNPQNQYLFEFSEDAGQILRPQGSGVSRMPRGYYYNIARMDLPSNQYREIAIEFSKGKLPSGAAMSGPGTAVLMCDRLEPGTYLLLTERKTDISRWHMVTEYPLAGYLIATDIGADVAAADSEVAREDEEWEARTREEQSARAETAARAAREEEERKTAEVRGLAHWGFVANGQAIEWKGTLKIYGRSTSQEARRPSPRYDVAVVINRLQNGMQCGTRLGGKCPGDATLKGAVNDSVLEFWYNMPCWSSGAFRLKRLSSTEILYQEIGGGGGVDWEGVLRPKQ